MSPTIAAIIPARYASSRFPGKPLALIAGKPMIQWVYERASQAAHLHYLLVATDDQRIYDAVLGFGGQAVLTSADCASGTDRVAQAARALEVDVVINVQGDEPLIEPAALDLVAQTLLSDNEAVMATLARQVSDPRELDNFNTARVVIDQRGRALYFSRAVIPYGRDHADKHDWPAHYPYYDQIGIYAYRKAFLLAYKDLNFSILEQAEKLEQLRALENGYVIKVGLCHFRPVCVDIPQDIAIVEQRLKELRNA